MKVGDKMQVPVSFGEDKPRRKLYPARVIYIHPLKRFFTVEAELDGGTVCESLYFNNRRGRRDVKSR